MRYEVKFLYPATHLPQVRLWMRLHPAGLRDGYPPRWVNNLYFDTHRLNCVSDNLDGTSLRNKLRLRWYGREQPITPHLELKHREGLLGDKEQVELNDTLDLTQPWHTTMGLIRSQLPPLWQSRFQAMAHPTLINRYWREYYVTPDEAIRVTLDSQMVAYDQRLASSPNLRLALPIEETIVIEVKADQSQADRVQALVNRLPVMRTRNSKYAKSMLTALYSQ